MGTRVPGYPHLKLTGTQVSLPGPGYIITIVKSLMCAPGIIAYSICYYLGGR